jgi:hypothetical protein
MVRLFNKWSIGDRSRLTKPIGPNELHMYPDNMKHTAKLPPRRDTVRKQFPVSSVRLNDKAIAARHEEVNQRRREKEKAYRHTVDRSQYAVRERLPPDHRLYHLATERSDPWQYKSRRVHTSLETAQWGHVVANKERIRGKKRLSDRPA